jgi:hypothetical protein
VARSKAFRCSSGRANDVLDALSFAVWKATHLDDLFVNDTLIQQFLDDSIANLQRVADGPGDLRIGQWYAAVVAHIRYVLAWVVGASTGRNGAEGADLVNRFRQLSAAVQAMPVVEFSDTIKKAREDFNELIKIFGGEPLGLTAEDPSAEFRATYLAGYIDQTSAKSSDYFAFFRDLKTAYAASPDAARAMHWKRRHCSGSSSAQIRRALQKCRGNSRLGLLGFYRSRMQRRIPI